MGNDCMLNELANSEQWCLYKNISLNSCKNPYIFKPKVEGNCNIEKHNTAVNIETHCYSGNTYYSTMHAMRMADSDLT